MPSIGGREISPPFKCRGISGGIELDGVAAGGGRSETPREPCIRATRTPLEHARQNYSAGGPASSSGGFQFLNQPMRLWASSDTITFDELASRVGEEVDVSFGLSPSYLGSVRTTPQLRGWPCDLTALGYAGLIQIPELGRTMTAMTGNLLRCEKESTAWLLESKISVSLLTHRGSSTRRFEGLIEAAPSAAVQVLGSLSIAGRELSRKGAICYKLRIQRFQSLCLRAGDPGFGQWFDVQRYGDLGSDPDVIGSAVCVAELDMAI